MIGEKVAHVIYEFQKFVIDNIGNKQPVMLDQKVKQQ